jgi:hypothetical protein
MTNRDRSESHSSRKSKRRIGSFIAIIFFLFTAWILISRVHSLNFTSYAGTAIPWISSSLSVFRVTLIVGFGGSLLSIPFLRRRGHDRAIPVRSIDPNPAIGQRKIHPLLLVSRPSRDPRFIIRKTRKRGRIARNRAGERLPPTVKG